MKKVLLYFALVLLVILLLLPLGLRLFAKDLYKKKEEKVQDVVEILSCNKLNETVNNSYLNGNPYSISYQIMGNFTGDSINMDITSDDSIVNDIKLFANGTYNDMNNITIFTYNFGSNMNMELVKNYILNIEEERAYYSNLGFSCTTSKN